MKNIRRFLLTMAAAAMVLFAPAGSMKAQANGNTVYGPTSSYITYTVSVQSGYLALRTAKAYDSSNEIGRLWNGDTVQVIDTSDSQYWYVYAPSLGKYGFVNKDYLKGASAPSSSSIGYTVKVSSGYLALRTAKAYDSSNEIGRLWTGDGVQVIDTSDSQYWYVYAPTLGKYGYVNKDYLVARRASIQHIRHILIYAACDMSRHFARSTRTFLGQRCIPLDAAEQKIQMAYYGSRSLALE